MEKNNNNLSLNAKIFLMVFSCIFIIGSWFFIFKPVKERNDLKIDDLY